MHNKCNVLESSQTYYHPGPWKNCLLWNQFLAPNTLRITAKDSVQFSLSVVSDSLQPHESQDARPPCPSPTPGVHSDSHPLSQWCYPAISSSVVPFSSCPQSLPAAKYFPMSQLFTWGVQSTGVSGLISNKCIKRSCNSIAISTKAKRPAKKLAKDII